MNDDRAASAGDGTRKPPYKRGLKKAPVILQPGQYKVTQLPAVQAVRRHLEEGERRKRGE